nr:hypothetical protein HmN_000973100 [Hymenolepis microstoma]
MLMSENTIASGAISSPPNQLETSPVHNASGKKTNNRFEEPVRHPYATGIVDHNMVKASAIHSPGETDIVTE